VNVIVHSLAEVNQALCSGELFRAAIVRDGIVLYELPGEPFATIESLSPADASELASGYYHQKLAELDRWL
jgi:uncharacterized protein